jgi:hypothetical protein
LLLVRHISGGRHLLLPISVIHPESSALLGGAAWLEPER